MLIRSLFSRGCTIIIVTHPQFVTAYIWDTVYKIIIIIMGHNYKSLIPPHLWSRLEFDESDFTLVTRWNILATTSCWHNIPLKSRISSSFFNSMHQIEYAAILKNQLHPHKNHKKFCLLWNPDRLRILIISFIRSKFKAKHVEVIDWER